MTLSRRRHDAERMKAKARRVYPHDPLAKQANHLAACSCHLCGNPRKHGGISMQERRANEAMKEEQNE